MQRRATPREPFPIRQRSDPNDPATRTACQWSRRSRCAVIAPRARTRIRFPGPMKFDSYNCDSFYDEIFTPELGVRTEAEPLVRMINALDHGELSRRQQAAERALLYSGITFTV